MKVVLLWFVALISVSLAGIRDMDMKNLRVTKVHSAEAKGHRTWIDIDNVKDDRIFAQIAIYNGAEGMTFARHNPSRSGDQYCQDFMPPNHGVVSACTYYYLLTADVFNYKRTTFKSVKDQLGGAWCKPVSDNPDRPENVLMLEKSDIRKPASWKSVGTYSVSTKEFVALDDKNQEVRVSDVTSISASEYNLDKLEVLCIVKHDYHN